mgnify:CR=1 FL=1
MYISRKDFFSLTECLLESCQRDINCDCDNCMFVVTNNRQGCDILLHIILNQLNIYDSRLNHKKKCFIIERELQENVSKTTG